MHKDTPIMGILEVNGPGWVTIGYLGSERSLIVDRNEWDAFIDLVKEINARVLEIRQLPNNWHDVMCQGLFEQCRYLLRYDGIDKDRVRQAVDRIREIVDEQLDSLQNSKLDDD